MSQLHTEQNLIKPDAPRDVAFVAARPLRAPLIDRLIDPSNVVFSLVFCQQTRREFEVRQAG